MNNRHSGTDALLNRHEPSLFQRFWPSPEKFLANALYSLLEPAIQAPKEVIRVVCISDTQNTQPKLPDGDLLLHAGDLTQSGSLEELQSQIEWLDSQPHKFKIAIAGNDDLYLDTSEQKSGDGVEKSAHVDWRSVIYLKIHPLHCFSGRPAPEDIRESLDTTAWELGISVSSWRPKPLERVHSRRHRHSAHARPSEISPRP
jgi:hypothetical protein